MIAQADGERQAVTLKAEGQKQSAILQAEDERQAAVLRAKGAGAPQRSRLKAEPKRRTPTAPLHPQGRGRLPLRQNPVAHGAVRPPPNPRQEEGRVPPPPLPCSEANQTDAAPRPRHSRKASLVETRRRSSATATPPQAGQRLQARKTPSPTTETQARAEDGTPAPRRQPPAASRRRLKTARRDPPAPPRQTESLRRVNRRDGAPHPQSHKPDARHCEEWRTFPPLSSFVFAGRRRMASRFYPTPCGMNVKRCLKPTAEPTKNNRKT